MSKGLPRSLANSKLADITKLTDNSTGVASDTIATIADAATKNAIASLAAKVNAILAAVK